MASLQPDDAVRYLARLGAGRAALLALVLAAACGGERNRPAAGDTTDAATVTPDSAATPVTDTAMPAAADSARSAAPTSDTSKATAAAPARKPAAPTTKPAPKPSVTAARPAAPADSTKGDSVKAPAAAPTPAATPPAQDTTTKTASADAPLRDEYHQAPHDTVSQSVYDGWKQFNLNCARCHGEDALGTTIAPHLILSLKPDGPINTKELFMQTVCAGRPEKGMPAWCALGLGMDKINNIYEYVKGRSDAKISPGRPAVKQQG